jgi:hypothetical protein
MKTQQYNVETGTSIRTAVEKAIIMARAVNNTIIVNFNKARFAVNPDSQIQDAINTYMDVKNKMYETEQQLKQKTK